MREKEAIDAERKAAMRHTAKQGILIAKLTENVKTFESQTVCCHQCLGVLGHLPDLPIQASLETENEKVGEKLAAYQERIDDLEGEIIRLRTSEESCKQMATKVC